MNKDERAAIAERMYREDETITIKQIAQQLGCSKMTIWRDLTDRGVEMRPSPAEYRRQRQAQQFLRRIEKRRAKEQRQLEYEEKHSEPSLTAILRLIDSL